jgi:hypothetical protein
MRRTILLSSAACSLRPVLAKGVTVVGIVALTVLAMRLFGPLPARGQSANLGDVQVTSITLVGADGTVLGRLGPGPTGQGNLSLFDTAGVRKVTLAGGSPEGGAGLSLVDDAGHPRVQVFYSTQNGLGGVRFMDANGPATHVRQPRYVAEWDGGQQHWRVRCRRSSARWSGPTTRGRSVRRGRP